MLFLLTLVYKMNMSFVLHFMLQREGRKKFQHFRKNSLTRGKAFGIV